MTLLADTLAEGLRRAVLLGGLAVSDAAAAGLVLLADDNSIEQVNPLAGELLAELGPEDAGGEHVPLVVQAVASRARSIAAGETQASPSLGPGSKPVRAAGWQCTAPCLATALRNGWPSCSSLPARPELAPLMAAAYGLTERERKVTQLVAQGLPTRDIAARLHLSAWTVQDHLKSIFTKTGAGTGGELVARLFFDHYAARLSQ